MTATIKNRKDARKWQKRYDALAPKVGDVAPDIELAGQEGTKLIRLSDFHGRKPVVLIFGSFT